LWKTKQGTKQNKDWVLTFSTSQRARATHGEAQEFARWLGRRSLLLLRSTCSGGFLYQANIDPGKPAAEVSQT
jgi:hypothetical protein